MSAVEDHAETATDQLFLADELAETRDQMRSNALTAAQVHALLAVAEAVRLAGMDAAIG